MPAYSKAHWPSNPDALALLQYLDDLHREAGRPSMHEIGQSVRLARNTIYGFFAGLRPISRGNLDRLVTYLDGDTVKAERLRRRAASARQEVGPAARPLPPVGVRGRGPWQVPPAPREVVARTDLVDMLTAMVCTDGGDTGVPTVAVYGAGGFGKTTLVAEACRRSHLKDLFPGGLLWVTLGRAATDAHLAAKINDLVYQAIGERPLLADPQQAGYRLGEVLDTGSDPMLLVVDDVWTDDQLRPFITGGPHCVRLFTTRNQRLLPPGRALHVDQMSLDEATRLLTRDVAGIADATVDDLVALTKGWPVLLDLTNRAMYRATRAPGRGVGGDLDATAVARRVASRLRSLGPTALDGFGGVHDHDRHEAVGATVGVGLDLLPAHVRRRYLELGIFAEEAVITGDVLELLWNASATDRVDVEQVCEDLFDLSMVVAYHHEPPGVRLHSVLRSYLRHLAGPAKIADDNRRLIASAARLVPQEPTAPGGAPAWWALPSGDSYLYEYLVDHLLDAGGQEEAARLVTDLRWAVARIGASGPTSFESDLGASASPAAAALRRVVVQSAHLFQPIEPPHSLGAVLTSRLDRTPELDLVVAAYLPHLPRPRLVNHWPLPDQPHPALERTLTGHTGPVTAVAIAPDGTWLATASDDRTVRTWNYRSGAQGAAVAHHADRATAVAIAPDGKWLATASDDRTVRTWDARTAQSAGPFGSGATVSALAIGPDGTWLVTGGDLDTNGDSVKLWNWPIDPTAVRVHDRTGWIYAIAVAPDGTWFATAGADTVVRVYDRATGNATTTLTGHTGWVSGVAVAPDGTWLASSGADGTVRIWDHAGGEARAVFTGHTGPVNAVAIAPDGTWLASSGADGTVRIWDRAGGEARAVFTGHTGPVNAVAISPDGTWLATAGRDHTIRIWTPASGRPLAAMRVAGWLNACNWCPRGIHVFAAGEAGSYAFELQPSA